jgi:hypothetical protein
MAKVVALRVTMESTWFANALVSGPFIRYMPVEWLARCDVDAVHE